MSSEHVYKIVELAGTSEIGIEDAVQCAITKASQSIRHLRWFEVQEMRGHIDNGKVRHYQVVIRVGFTLEDNR